MTEENGGRVTMAIIGERLDNVKDLLERIENSLTDRLDKCELRIEKIEDRQADQKYWNYGLTGLGSIAAVIAAALGIKTN